MEASVSDKYHIMIPYFWELFLRYLNDPHYYMKEEDIMATKFGRGDDDVVKFIDACNKKAQEHELKVVFRFRKNMTYGRVLKQLNKVKV